MECIDKPALCCFLTMVFWPIVKWVRSSRRAISEHVDALSAAGAAFVPSEVDDGPIPAPH